MTSLKTGILLSAANFRFCKGKGSEHLISADPLAGRCLCFPHMVFTSFSWHFCVYFIQRDEFLSLKWQHEHQNKFNFKWHFNSPVHRLQTQKKQNFTASNLMCVPALIRNWCFTKFWSTQVVLKCKLLTLENDVLCITTLLLYLMKLLPKVLQDERKNSVYKEETEVKAR